MKNIKKGTPYPVEGIPETPEDIINKYGTYEVQDTANTENDFPKIAQGLPKQSKVKKERHNSHIVS